jgi:hypothetical protein
MARQMCQSCGMPLKKGSDYGTEANGDTSGKYCVHCYSDGAFTWKGATAEQMQIYCTGILMKKHWPGFMAKLMTHNIPKLDRWKSAGV